MSSQFDQELDCSGLTCPMPIIKTKKKMDTLHEGQVLKMIATDPGSLPDVEAWTSKTGNQLLSHEKEGNKFIFYIKKTK
jgi:tRNA 2-thiouridine synthesizing protein A